MNCLRGEWKGTNFLWVKDFIEVQFPCHHRDGPEERHGKGGKPVLYYGTIESAMIWRWLWEIGVSTYLREENAKSYRKSNQEADVRCHDYNESFDNLNQENVARVVNWVTYNWVIKTEWCVREIVPFWTFEHTSQPHKYFPVATESESMPERPTTGEKQGITI